jgi:hypothetical protein
MAKTIIKFGGIYVAYEIVSTAALAAAVAYGINLPGL